MKFQTKLLSLALALVMTVCCLASCNLGGNNNINGDGGSGDVSIDTDVYICDVEIKFATADDKMKDVAYAMSSSSKILSDGDNLFITTKANTGNVSVKDSYTLHSGILYRETNVTVGDISASERFMSNGESLTKDQLLASVDKSANIGLADFYTIDTIDTATYTTIFYCSELLDEAKERLSEIYSSEFSVLGDAIVILKDAELEIETFLNATQRSILSCHFEIILGGESYEITMHTYKTYNYSILVRFDAPIDTESYKPTSLKDIIG